jgi:GT2 family glycosyltransferase
MSNSAETTRRPRVCALLTSFNRRDKTVSCLQRLGASAAAHGIELSAVLVDDGSTDGTAALVSEAFDWVHVIVNQAEPLFWCRGMHRAFAAALEKGYDHYLLLNDDTMLDDDALPRLLSDAAACASRTQMPVIVVGSTRDSKLGTLTYGGQNRPNPGKYTTFVKIEPAGWRPSMPTSCWYRPRRRNVWATWTLTSSTRSVTLTMACVQPPQASRSGWRVVSTARVTTTVPQGPSRMQTSP